MAQYVDVGVCGSAVVVVVYEHGIDLFLVFLDLFLFRFFFVVTLAFALLSLLLAVLAVLAVLPVLVFLAVVCCMFFTGT